MEGNKVYEETFKDFMLEKRVDKELINEYKELLPTELLNVWEQYGFGSLLNGYLKIINPKDYIEVLEDSYYASSKAIPIMVTGFGDLIIWKENRYIMMLKYKELDSECIASTMKWFWGDLLDKNYTDDYFELKQYEKAVAKYGKLAYGECFGYTPLLGLGGSKKIANLDKVTIREHIELITAMMGRIE